MPGKWMSPSGLIIEVAACAMHSLQTRLSRVGASSRVSGKGLRTGCSSQVPVNRKLDAVTFRLLCLDDFLVQGHPASFELRVDFVRLRG